MRGRSGLIIGLAALALAATAAETQGKAGPPAAGGAPGKPAAAGYRTQDAKLAAGDVARVGDKKVTAADVSRRVGDLRKQAGMGHNEPERLREVALNQLLDELVLPAYLVKEVRLAKDARVARMNALYELLYLANIYEREKIKPKVTVSEAEIAALLPRSREERRIRMLLLPDDETEATVRAAAAAGTRFDELVARHSRGATPLRGDLGFTRQSGVYFTPDVEDYLWSLPIGKLSRRIDTQIGPAIAVTEEARRIGDKEWEYMRVQNRDQEARERLGVFLKGVVDRHRVEVDEKAFYEAAGAMLAEDRFADRVVGGVDGIKVYFHDVDRVLEYSVQDILMKAKQQEVAARYSEYFRNILAPRLAVGLEAQRLGLELGPKEQASVQRLGGKAMVRVAVQDVLKDVKVTDKDVESEYAASSERLGGAERARLGVIVTDTLDQAMQAIDEYNRGTHFALLVAQYSKDAKTKQKGGEIGWLRSESFPEEIAESIAETAAGQFFPVFKSPQGDYHAVLLMEKEKVQIAPLARVAPAIRRRLLRQRREQAIDARFGTIRASVLVEVDQAQLATIAVSKGGQPGTSPHGGH